MHTHTHTNRAQGRRSRCVFDRLSDRRGHSAFQLRNKYRQVSRDRRGCGQGDIVERVLLCRPPKAPSGPTAETKPTPGSVLAKDWETMRLASRPSGFYRSERDASMRQNSVLVLDNIMPQLIGMIDRLAPNKLDRVNIDDRAMQTSSTIQTATSNVLKLEQETTSTAATATVRV